MSRFQGKVAFITGAARGQGRSHAVRFAQEGGDVIALDLCGQIDTVSYPMSTDADLAETTSQVEAIGRRIIARKADVRDSAAVRSVAEEGFAEFGRIDLVIANAGIGAGPGMSWETPDETWQDMIDVNLTGVRNTCKAAIPHMIAGGSGGSVALISSILGLRGMPGVSQYVAAKHGVVGLMKALAIELADHNIRVNSVHSTNVNTPMIRNDVLYGMFRPDLQSPTDDDVIPAFSAMHLIKLPWVESEDVTNAVLWLASDEARYITGVSLPVDLGFTVK